jgi:hypothetical protein
VPRADAPHGLADAVRDALGAALAAAGVIGVAVDARTVDEIPREPGGAAKLKQIKVGQGT